jgi:hypothetical protein
MELQQSLNAVNSGLEALVEQRNQIMIKLCNYKLTRLLSISFEILHYIHDNSGNRQVTIYIPSLLLEIIVRGDSTNTVYDINYSDIEHVQFYRDEIHTSTFKLVNDAFPDFKEVFIDKLEEWFII